jgi:hypothetical protein
MEQGDMLAVLGEDLHELTVNKMFERGPNAWQWARRVLIRAEPVSYRAAMTHLAVAEPFGMVVKARRGPKGGWVDATYTHEQVRALPQGSPYQWYIVVRIVPRGQPKPKFLSE